MWDDNSKTKQYILIPPQINSNLTFYDHLCMILHYCTSADGITHPGWMFPTVIKQPKYNYIDQLVNINTYHHIKLWWFIAIQCCSNICPNWLNCSFGSSLYGVKIYILNVFLLKIISLKLNYILEYMFKIFVHLFKRCPIIVR